MQEDSVRKEAASVYKMQKYKERVSKKYRVGPPKNFSGLFQEKRSIFDEIHIRDEVEKNKRPSLPKLSDIPSSRAFLWNYKKDQDYTKYRPSAREGATLTCIDYKIYLFGGSSFKTFSDLMTYDLRKEVWVKAKESEEFLGRSFHSAFANKKNLVVFGGQKSFNDQTKSRDNLNDLRSFNPETKEWSIIRNSGDFVDPRSCHASFSSGGKFFFIYGGYLNGDKISNEMFALDLSTFKWQQVQVEPELPGRVYHAAVSVFKDGSSLRGIYDPIEESNTSSPMNIGIQLKPQPIAQGIYIFGGLNELSQATDELRFVNFTGKKPLIQALVETTGIKPSPRYLHTLNYHSGLAYLIVYGGRNDDIFSKNNQENCFNDIHLLSLSTLGWSEVLFLNKIPRNPRAGHASLVIGTRLFIFGGSNFQENFVETVFDMIELSSDQAKDAAKRESLRLKEEEEFMRRNKGKMGSMIMRERYPYGKVSSKEISIYPTGIERKPTKDLAMLPMPILNHHLNVEEAPQDSKMRDKLKKALSFAKITDKVAMILKKNLRLPSIGEVVV